MAMKKFVACAIILMTIFSMFSIQTIAEDTPAIDSVIEKRASDLIKSYSCSLSRNGKSLSASCVITATGIMDKIGVSSFSIQEKRNGAWVSVKSITGNYNYNRTAYTNSLTYTGKAGYEYRAVANFYVKDGSLSDTANKSSTRKEIPVT